MLKKIISLFMLGFVLFPYSVNAHEEIESDIIIQLDGITCQACVESMNKVFSKSESIIGLHTDLETQSITIDLVEGGELTDEKIKENIEWGGYDLISIERPE